ncbi:dienelactone hydrolase family protein [Fretibacter rubidus]|uniref:dienelactone hydrolase family protein n=1 Tax=Fretibacter rubidus TaxID=570162 RepID=UPI00352AD809
MPSKKASDFSPKLLELYDFYVHGMITKRDFLGRAASLGIGAVAATTMLGQLMPDYAAAETVDTAGITEERITFNSPEGHGAVNGLIARPIGTEPLGAVLVIHENRGLNPYIEDVVRRTAKAGYLALGPDGLSSLGGYPGTDDEGRTMQRSLDGAKVMADFFAGFEFLQSHAQSTGKVGAVGFCYGGGVCNALAVAYPDMACSVPFYGRHADADDVPAIQAPLLVQLGETDKRINAGWPAYEKALLENGKTYEAHIYAGAGHGFHNNTTPRYNPEAATLAWNRTLAWFDKYIR